MKKNEEIFWAQKSKINWLKWGDRNSRFFHISTMAKRQQNRITALQDQNGEWVKEHKDISRVDNNYYRGLFKSSNPEEETMDEFLEEGENTLSNNAKTFLDQPISREETKKAAFELDKLKAPSPDGLQTGFFQEY